MTEKFIPVKDMPSLCRDAHSRAIVNTNSAALEQAKRIKMLSYKKETELENIKADINNLRETINELKQLIIGGLKT